MGCSGAALALSWGLEVGRLAFLAPAADPPAWVEPYVRALRLRPDVVARLRSRSEARLRVRWDELHVCDLARGLARRPPLLIVHDRADETVAWNDGAAIASAWPGSTFISTEGLGHRGVTRMMPSCGRSSNSLPASPHNAPAAASRNRSGWSTSCSTARSA
jgi:hypothetical protein